MTLFVPFYRYKFGGGYFVAAALSPVIAEVGDRAKVEIEIGAGQRVGGLRAPERWAALDGRWKYFPSRNDLRTTIAVSTGPSEASSLSTIEFRESGNGKGSRLPHDLSAAIACALPSDSDREPVFGKRHRSGGGVSDGDSVAVAGSIFHRTGGGSQ